VAVPKSSLAITAPSTVTTTLFGVSLPSVAGVTTTVLYVGAM